MNPPRSAYAFPISSSAIEAPGRRAPKRLSAADV
jgi:hypothetical protein